MGAYSDDDEPVAVSFLGTVLERLRVAQLGKRHFARCFQLGARQVTDEYGAAPPTDLDRLPFLNRRQVDLDRCNREYIGGRIHRIDQWPDRDGATHRGERACGDVDEITAAHVTGKTRCQARGGLNGHGRSSHRWLVLWFQILLL